MRIGLNEINRKVDPKDCMTRFEKSS